MENKIRIHPSIQVSHRAAAKLKKIQKTVNNQICGLRFSIKQGLCGSGYEYILDFATAPEANEEVFYSEGITIFVPRENITKLQGSYIEFETQTQHCQEKEGLEKVGFKVLNPNIKGPCPCQCVKGVDL